eukprot:TRINITY_DN59815_c0_g1_i2.p1 TRINITY_DN59815_c0_g1~~TRINITY_DN59815_c0_g1_i2.p1  ORF type:complete len:525 (-),score=112.50 TRINITY_DN59815_c0_g1_i2:200-1774(-)
MLRSLVGSEMCIRDSINAEYGGFRGEGTMVMALLEDAGMRRSPGFLTFSVLALGLFVRKLTSLHSYSGEGVAPMFGDYEAQRHWMEMTVNLPASEWYTNSSNNDLQYWGLDYPPLTAYHAWTCGTIAKMVEPEMVELRESRGYETPSSKLFMRATVLVADGCILLPALWLFVSSFYRAEPPSRRLGWLLVLLLQPALILIDHGHFQYNGISLGLVTFAVAAASLEFDYLCAVFFTLALLYKQMALYFALPFFFFLLGKALCRPTIAGKLAMVGILGVVVISLTAIHWLPWLHSTHSALEVVYRIFPFNRGIYEDKVANFWGASSLLIKWNRVLAVQHLVVLSTALTLLATLVSSLPLLRLPNTAMLLRALAGGSLAFFLFSFQVHEKTVLFPLLPVTLLGLHDKQPGLVCHLALVSCFSMFPLLSKDGLTAPYFCTVGLFSAVAVGFCGLPASWDMKGVAMGVSLMGMGTIHVIQAVWTPPARYPDLVTYMFICFSAAHFFTAWALVSYKQLSSLLSSPKSHQC